MSKELLQTAAPLDRNERGLAIINYILAYEERCAKARQLALYSIGGTALEGGCNVVDPTIINIEQTFVNACLLENQGIDTTLEEDGASHPVRLMEWQGPNQESPGQHNWFGYLMGPVPQAGIMSLDMAELRLEMVQQSRQL